MHVFREQWKAFERGDLSREHLLRELVLHALECWSCGRFFTMYETGSVQPTEDVCDLHSIARPTEKAVLAQVRELAELNLDERLDKMARARTRFRGVEFVKAVLVEAREARSRKSLDDTHGWLEVACAASRVTSGFEADPFLLLALVEEAELLLAAEKPWEARCRVELTTWFCDRLFGCWREPTPPPALGPCLLGRLSLTFARAHRDLGWFLRADLDYRRAEMFFDLAANRRYARRAARERAELAGERYGGATSDFAERCLEALLPPSESTH